MKYTVKNKDGELTYQSLEEVKTAYVLGLVEAEDDVLEAGATLPRKAGAIPLLVTARKVNVDRGQSRVMLGWTAVAVVASIIYFFLIVKSFISGYFAVLMGFPVALLLIRVTTLAAKKPKR